MKKFMNTLKNIIKNYHPPKYVIFSIFIILILLAFYKTKEFDNDTWFLLNHGRYVFEHGIPHIEPFTIHEGFKFVMQQWLTSSIFWILYSKIGILGLQLFVAVIFAITIYFLYKLCMLVSKQKFYLSSAITIITCSLLLIQTVLRPQLFDILILVMELYFLELYVRKEKNKYLIALPILSFLLINLHASMWFMLVAFIIPYIIDSFNLNLLFIKGTGYKKTPLFIALLLVILAGFINPYGLDSITYVFRSYGVGIINEMVEEMNSLSLSTLIGKIEILLMFLTILICIFYKKSRIKLRYLLLYLGVAYLGLLQNRNFSIFLIGSMFCMSEFLSPSFKEYVRKYKSNQQHINIIYIFVCICLIVYSTFIFNNISFETKVEVKNAVDYIVNNYDVTTSKVYTSYNDGGYAEFKGLSCYIDPRAELFLRANNKKENILLEYYKLQYLNDNGVPFLAKYNFDLLILDKWDNLKNYKDKNYKLVYKDENREVYELKKE